MRYGGGVVNRRQLFRNAISLVGAATIAPSILNEALPLEEVSVRMPVEIFEQGEWMQIAGLDAIKAGQLFRLLQPDTLEQHLIDMNHEDSWFGIAVEDGSLVRNHLGHWVGGALTDYFPTLEAALLATVKR
jgi:hypothetical protein